MTPTRANDAGSTEVIIHFIQKISVSIPQHQLSSGVIEDEILTAALVKASEEGFDPASEVVRYEIIISRRPGQHPAVSIFHDADHLDALHEERVEDFAGIYTLPDVEPVLGELSVPAPAQQQEVPIA